MSAHAVVARDPGNKETDAAALRAIAQGAVSVELFTLPLYMTAMYSIQGMHAITSASSNLYQGRLWPGAKPSAAPDTPNKQAFNILYSIFIEEMLHLQMAANMATAIGVTVSFGQLQNSDNGWTCYGPAKTVIPNIIDLQDLKENNDLKVDVDGLTERQCALFKVIEESEDTAKTRIQDDKLAKYFPQAPFANWKSGDALPMFGSIGHMYQCYHDYLGLTYSDGTTLWDYVIDRDGKQNDLFNIRGSSSHPLKEYPGFSTTLDLSDPKAALAQMLDMMDAITDQGEGSTLNKIENNEVKTEYRADDEALKRDYPSYSDTGRPLPSASAQARAGNDKEDHYQRFIDLGALVPKVTTWAQWHQSVGVWTEQDLQPDPAIKPPYDLPSAADVAKALNDLNSDTNRANTFDVLSKASVGSIAGITTVLDQYWAKGSTVSFPSPSMTGSGDRLSIIWAVLGKAPDLAHGASPKSPGLQHACQSLAWNQEEGKQGYGTNSCADVGLYHSCRGSNNCSAQGGCGFVQSICGGGSCSTPKQAVKGSVGGGCGLPVPDSNVYSSPSDNKCKTFGGCAVPMSASQLFPDSGIMMLYDFNAQSKAKPIGSMAYEKGEQVHEVAYRAFRKVMDFRQQPVPDNPQPPTALRLAFPPST
jgi:hypothetical protein